MPPIRVTLPLVLLSALAAQPPGPPDAPPNGPPGRRGGPGPGAREQAIKARFDADHDGRLDDEERAKAREHAKANAARGGGRRGRGFPGGGAEDAAARGEERVPVRFAPEDAPVHPDQPLYDLDVVRTVFLEFPTDDWFEECADFYRTDVDVPATMVVDGKTYPNVGVAVRGNSSYFGARGRKKSFGIAVDDGDDSQRLYGYRTLNLLNAHADPSFVREVLHAFVARQFMPALQANLVRLVVNGESFGVYANVQQFNKDFLAEEFGTKGGVRWKVPANFAGAGLAYVGDDLDAYRGAYQLKTGVDEPDAAVARLVNLCRVLDRTSLEELPAALPAVLDVDAALRFLAIDTVLLDGDGYGSRGSDFLLWERPDGRFVPLPYDSNEVLGTGGGPGMRGPGGMRGEGRRPGGEGNAEPPPGRREGRGGGRGGRGGPGAAARPTSGPLVIAESGRPLARLLQVPAWRVRYLAFVRAMAEQGLDWTVLGPVLQRAHDAIDPLVAADEKALYGYEAFARSLEPLQSVIATRRAALLEHESMQQPWPEVADLAHAVVRDGESAAVHVTAHATGAERVVLWWSDSRAEAFTPVSMHDDGQHGDGAADDGTWGAATPARPAEGRLHLFVEALAEDAAVTFAPPGGSGRPRSVSLTLR